jgi:hypothetical protein
MPIDPSKFSSVLSADTTKSPRELTAGTRTIHAFGGRRAERDMKS